ncbi:RHS repeat domain-containing protein [uncultured Winogradskyella sp.]|uniref:RHS repeat domain-containing protein n=1 Tax=uncultured Winogradskyella sp. TaxID=395353 RepID=UPI002609DCCF|nr:RHS repeat domain-containing protein [uncultured Winogradskyella sp.]
MKNRLTVFFIFLIALNLQAQELPNVIPPSPEASSLISYSQTQVSPYTGLPSIQIPFHSINYKGVSIPISLTYNSGGVKVEDIASWVGLGWNLNAGGLVSRTINWLPDNSPNGYMNTTYTLEHFADNPDTTEYCCNSNEQTAQLLSYISDQRDYEPDEFNYSIPGYSGTFYYDQTDDKFIQVPYTNVNIEMIEQNGRINGFIINTPDGIRYHFGGSAAYREKTQSVKSMTHTQNGIFENTASLYASNNPYNQSWLLHHIEFPSSSETIDFIYGVEADVKTIVRQDEELILNLGSGCPEEYNINYAERKFTQPRLQEIIFPSGRVLFVKGTTERTDLKNSYPLDKIVLYDNNDAYVKGINLHHSQSLCSSGSTYNMPFFALSDNTEAEYRLKLDAVSLVDENDNEEARYTLEYNTQKLPQRYSRSIDYFGYYNGQQNADLIPKARHRPSVPTGLIGNANRMVQPNFTQAETLTKIILPTGGSEEFVWENNSASLFENNIPTFQDYQEETAFFLQNSSLFADSDVNVDYSKTFTVDPNSDGWVSFLINMSGCNGPNLSDTNCDFTLKLVGISTQLNEPILQNSFNKQLLPGQTYKITAKSVNGSNCDPFTDPSCSAMQGLLDVICKYNVDPTPGEYLFGGLRIAEINAYDYLATIPASSRSFDYTFHDDHASPNQTSGMVISLPINSIDNYKAVCSGNVSNGTIKINSNAPLFKINGSSYIGYTNVTEITASGVNTNGYKEYEYSNEFLSNIYPYSNTYYNSPFPSVNNKSILPNWRNGNLLKLSHYDKVGSKVKEQLYEYEVANTFHKPSTEFAIQVYRMPDNGLGNNLYVRYYGYTTEWQRIKHQTTTDYLSNGDVTTSVDYFYDNNPLLASEVNSHNSNETLTNVLTYYPEDVTSLSSLGESLTTQEKSAIDLLKTPTLSNTNGQHRIAMPLQTKTTVKDLNGTVLSQNTTRTNYKDWGAGVIEPEFIQTSKADNLLENRIEFKDYDSDGNILQVKKSDGMDITYIYGYGNSLPVAKIENATYSQVSGHVANIQSKSNLDNDHCQDSGSCNEKNLRTALNALRSSLPDAMISTYTYDPLIGVTSMTDPNGNIAYYEYDEFNRLVRVKDKDGYILNENKYHYFLNN